MIFGRIKFLLSTLLMLLFIGCSTGNNEEKLIKKYLNEHLNDIDSYSPVSFSSTDTLKTEWKLPVNLEQDFNALIKCADRINASGYSNINVTSDANYHIKELDKFNEPKYQNLYSGKKKEDFYKEIEMWKKLWVEFKRYQDIIYDSKNSFVPQFIGWKVVHKYRAKNKNGGVELKEEAFYFDKEKTRITGVKKIE